MRCRGPATPGCSAVTGWCAATARTQRTVEAALAGAKPHLMTTDPPYGVAYDPAWRNRMARTATKRTGRVLNDDRADWREAWALFGGEVAYVWHGALHATTVAESLLACGFELRAQIVWAKDALVLGRGHYHWKHEPCWYAVRAATGTGMATAARRRCGRSRAASRTPPPCTARRSRWSACAGRS